MTEPKCATVEALARVAGQLGPIGKGGTAPPAMGGYAFRQIEDVTAALRPLLAAERLVCIPTVLERMETTRTTKNGVVQWVVDLCVEFAWRCTGGEVVTARVWGQGLDTGDKATQKAMTAALKSMLTVVFCISAGGDAEAEVIEEARPSSAAPPERSQVMRAWDAVAADGNGDAAWEEWEIGFRSLVEMLGDEAREAARAHRKEAGMPWPCNPDQGEELMRVLERHAGVPEEEGT